MEFLDHLALGFSVSLTAQNLAYCFLGVLIGTLIGVLPGIGPIPTIAMLLPTTYALPPTTGLIMLSGIYYGAQYGGSTTAILVNLPGEVSSVVTCLDGYQMARKGRAGPALAIAAIGSFLAGCVATLLIAAFATPLAAIAFEFGPAEYFSLMVLSLVGAVVLASGSLLKAIGMILLGLALGMIGTDVNSGVARFTFDVPQFADGFDFAVVAMGIFGFAEIITNLENSTQREVFLDDVKHLYPTMDDMRAAMPAMLRGTAIGSLLGLLPGSGAAIAAFAAYTVEKRLSRTPERFGQGAIEGVAAPESANNAAAQTSFVPLLTLGIPPNAVMALMVGAMMIHSIQPGPQVITKNPELFWGLITSMWIGNLLLVILNLPLVGIWVRLLRIPYPLLYPAILAFCCIGTYTLKSDVFDVLTTAIFGLLGYIWLKLRCECAPFLLGFVLSTLLEQNFRRALVLSRGDFSTFVTSPLSAALLALTAVIVILALLPALNAKRAILSGT